MYSWVDHTGELELRIEADSPEAVLREAAAAVADALADRVEEEAVPASRAVEVEAGDLPALLAEWIAELAFLAETEGFVPREVCRLDLAGTSVSATVDGAIGAPRGLIKAVTYHRLTMEEKDGGWSAGVVLDV